jgi:hypothetical protein
MPFAFYYWCRETGSDTKTGWSGVGMASLPEYSASSHPSIIKHPVTVIPAINPVHYSKALNLYLEVGGISMIRTLYSSICGVLIFIAALIPAAILIMDKAGF